MIGKQAACMAAALAILSTITATSAVAGKGCNWANCKNSNMKALDVNRTINVDVNLPRNFAATFATGQWTSTADATSASNSAYSATGAVVARGGVYAASDSSTGAASIAGNGAIVSSS